MASWTTCKMVALHHTGETFAFAGADHIHMLANAKDFDGQLITGLKPGSL